MFGAPSTMRRALVVPSAVAALLTLFGGALAHGSSETLDECVRRKTAGGTERAVAVAECATATNNNSSNNNSSASSDDGGTSIGALLAAGVVGAALGAGAMVLQRRQRPAGTSGATQGAAPAGMAPPAMAAPVGMPPPGAMAAPAPAPAVDARVDSLVNALIDLGDRVNSTALRAEIVAALAAAGVQALEPPPGTPFDASRMRGVGNAPAPSPAAIGTVATTDRVGYASATRVLRLPDVVVYTAS